MGLLESMMQIGSYYSLQDRAGDLADLVNYLELPLPMPDDNTKPERRPQVICVALDAADPASRPLEVRGIDSIHLADYPGPFANQTQAKLGYLYKAPAGANVTWGFAPIYKLGKGVGEKAQDALMAVHENTPWHDDKDTRYYKLHKRVLADYEDSGFFTPGSTDRLMAALVQKADQIAGLWQDRKRSYLLVFGVKSPAGFQYPGQVPLFADYFRAKLAEKQAKTAKKSRGDCMLCHKTDAASRTLNQVFKFSTFDKPGFLPGGKTKNAFAVFPVCEACYALLQRGYTEAENHFTSRIGIMGLDLLAIPEFIGDPSNLSRLENLFSDFLKTGVEREMGMFEKIARHDASFVFHFLFTEKNQAQVRLLRLVEDIPPSHFRKLHQLWNRKRAQFFPKTQDDAGTVEVDLDSAIRQMVAMILSLAGKTENDQVVMQDQAVNLIADLFNNAPVDVASLKRAAAARLPGLLSDASWLNAPHYNGAFKLERLFMLFEFLTIYNQHLDQEEVNSL